MDPIPPIPVFAVFNSLNEGAQFNAFSFLNRLILITALGLAIHYHSSASTLRLVSAKFRNVSDETDTTCRLCLRRVLNHNSFVVILT